MAEAGSPGDGEASFAPHTRALASQRKTNAPYALIFENETQSIRQGRFPVHIKFLGLHSKPIGMLNVGGFFDPFMAMLDHAAREAFLDDSYRDFLLVDGAPARLLDRLAAWQGPKPAQPAH